eukprot:3008651-Alexandrium_andersonii.AAC.1
MESPCPKWQGHMSSLDGHDDLDLLAEEIVDKQRSITLHHKGLAIGDDKLLGEKLRCPNWLFQPGA